MPDRPGIEKILLTLIFQSPANVLSKKMMVAMVAHFEMMMASVLLMSFKWIRVTSDFQHVWLYMNQSRRHYNCTTKLLNGCTSVLFCIRLFRLCIFVLGNLICKYRDDRCVVMGRHVLLLCHQLLLHHCETGEEECDTYVTNMMQNKSW